MKTDDLVIMLATGAGAVPRNVAAHRYAIALGWGLSVSFVLMLTTIGLLADLKSALTLPGFWVKLAFVVSLAGTGLAATLCLSRPGARCENTARILASPVIVLWVIALVVLAQADADQRLQLVMGKTSTVCPELIAMLALPIFVATFWSMRGLAPTRLRLAGACAGLFSGAAGACVYTLHCPEMDAPFIAVWYLIGILIPALIGSVLGPRLLRW